MQKDGAGKPTKSVPSWKRRGLHEARKLVGGRAGPAVIIRIPLSSEIGETGSPRILTTLISMQDVLRWLSDRPARQLKECLTLAHVASQFHDCASVTRAGLLRQELQEGHSWTSSVALSGTVEFVRIISGLVLAESEDHECKKTMKLNSHPFHYIELWPMCAKLDISWKVL